MNDAKAVDLKAGSFLGLGTTLSLSVYGSSMVEVFERDSGKAFLVVDFRACALRLSQRNGSGAVMFVLLESSHERDSS